MGDFRQEAKEKFTALAQQEGVIGAVLVSRDGISVLDVLNRPLNQEMFAAMSAMMMGAAESAVGELGKGSPRHLVVEADNLRFVVLGANEDLLLVVLTDTSVALDGLTEKLEGLVQEIKSLAG